MLKEKVNLEALHPEDWEQFILDNQWAFKYGAMEEFGVRDEHYEEDGEIISRATIIKSIEEGTAYRIVLNGEKVGGLVVRIKGDVGELDLLFVKPDCHTKGIGYGAWCAVEEMHSEVKKWETCTPYFETRNIHFYINKCGFHAVEFYNGHHGNGGCFDEMFRFEKIITS